MERKTKLKRETLINKINLIKCVYENMFFIIDQLKESELKESELKSKLINIYDYAIYPLYELLEKETLQQIKEFDKQQIKDLIFYNHQRKNLISLENDLKKMGFIKK